MSYVKKLYYPPQNLNTDSKGRVHFYDNMRFILIVLVVLSHFLMRVEYSQNRSSTGNQFDEVSAFYIVFSWFMMPLFIFITGFFAKSLYSKEGNFRTSRIVTFFALFVAMDFVIYLTKCLVKGGFETWQPYAMYAAQWFLFACGIWFLLIPILRKTPAKIAIPVSFLLGVLGGFILGGIVLAISKIFAFLPFFVIGYYLERKDVERLLVAKARWRVFSWLFFVGFFALTLAYLDEFWVYVKPVVEGVRSYFTMFRHDQVNEVPLALTMVIRVGWYIATIAISVLFMLIVPMKKMVWTKLGTRTLQIYIWHCVVVRLLRITPLYPWLLDLPRGIGEVLLIAVTLACSLLLAFKPLVAPIECITKLVARIPDRDSSNATRSIAI